MKKAIVIGFAAASLLALVGTGCAPQSQQTSPATPAVKAPAPTPVPSGATTTKAAPSGKKVDLTQDDLNMLKRDVQALQVQDLTTLKQ
ncbi:hypothetical protein A3E39_04680 [Candidatus Uhrbacteria bacterium RIFCSPHIGHO2_12_FULL_60_25]|uniref:Uncharacterized protein n=1 Tax=Candidatus Uhrbacteria bacterium RIFCSPHIGHO2_12_FULL_60_25 TaxID=1802399 RepID=A0A1F7UJ81_9BACT|nr:MAG: hypothetical protein A3D73_04025 [Candidatus Uhrbacteria bacterium RIFCSPHIGHO2_02_FULL_60_44]OGL78330.1 MAG: hypothetical protein A3E39_04680 [Candidatus Uhrbacteria bacterium RIFCSPHIGHO2_12_FULL_60_25]